MREELKGPKVENVAIAVILEDVESEKEFGVYLLSFREDIMEGVIISSTGYGENAQTGEKIKTSTLRHSLEVLLPNEAAKIEPILPELFGLTNEYWVSFWVDEIMYDKRFIIPAESVSVERMKVLEHFKKPVVIIK